MRDHDRPDDFLSPAELMRRHGLRAKKPWGQNFLHQRSLAAQIVTACQLKPTDTVIEIGAGLGALTALLAKSAGRVLAIERDRDLAEVLRNYFCGSGHVTIIEANALTVDYSQWGDDITVVGNLPYHISSPLLFHLIEYRKSLRRAVLMFQRELANRLAAEAGSREYGIPSVLLQNIAQVKPILRAARGAFTPAPRVDSAVVELVWRSSACCDGDTESFTRVVRAAFARRRKTIQRALSAVYSASSVAGALRESNISPQRRAETLDIDDYCRLSKALDRAHHELTV